MNMHYQIVEPIAVLGTSIDQDGNRWTTELNLVSWLDRKPVFDIRAWNESHTSMHYGIKLDKDEIDNLFIGLQSLYKGAKNDR